MNDDVTERAQVDQKQHVAAVKRRKRIQRDTLIVIFTLTMAAFEIVFGGARASVFTFLGGLLISPLVLRYDETRKEERDD